LDKLDSKNKEEEVVGRHTENSKGMVEEVEEVGNRTGSTGRENKGKERNTEKSKEGNRVGKMSSSDRD